MLRYADMGMYLYERSGKVVELRAVGQEGLAVNRRYARSTWPEEYMAAAAGCDDTECLCTW